MSQLESKIIALIVGITCPFLTFVAFWWTAAAFHLYVIHLPLGVIITTALTGLGLGCLLDVIFLLRWVRNFYTANTGLMVALYLGLCVVAVGSFMGLPVGTFSLGIAAGAYVGRRVRHRQGDGTQAAVALRRVAVFAASVTAAAALPIGILALQSEQRTLRLLEDNLRLDQNSLQGSGGWVLIGILCLLLFAMQYWSTRIAGRLAFGTGTGRLSPCS